MLRFFDATVDSDVRVSLLSNLTSLAEKLPNQWTASHISVSIRKYWADFGIVASNFYFFLAFVQSLFQRFHYG